MNIALPGRRPLAALLAFILLVAGLAFIAPAAPAHAANNSSYAASFLKLVNQKRVAAGKPAFLANESINKFAAEYVALIAKNRGDEEPATAVPAGFTAGDDANAYVFGGSSTSSRFSYAKTNFPGNSNFGPVVVGNFNYGAVGVYTTSSRVYVYLVALQYNTPLFAKYGSPTISGTVKVGNTITAKPGTYSPAADSYTYQWKANGSVVGSNSSTFVPRAAQKGQKITVTVTATKSGYLVGPAKTSAPKTVATGTVKLSNLVISGARNVGQILTATDVTVTPATAEADLTPTFQWYRDGKAIAGQTGIHYTQVAGDRGKKITFKVIVRGTGYTSASISSKTSTLTGYPLQTLKPTPTISGSLAYKQVLTANPGTWDAGTTLSYQWYASGKAISGATKSTYTLPSTVIGKQITVRVTSKKSQFATSSATSAASVPVAALTFDAAGTAAITGDFVKGKTLTASVTGTSPAATYSYQWYKSDTNTKITGATKSKLVLTQTHINYGAVSVRVSVKKTGYTTVVLSAMRGAL